LVSVESLPGNGYHELQNHIFLLSMPVFVYPLAPLHVVISASRTVMITNPKQQVITDHCLLLTV
jgi:hypothetical protein